MKAIYLAAPESLAIRDVPEPDYGPGEVLVRIRAGGVCGTDVSTYLGKHFLRRAPAILGHEVAGEVAGVGADVRGWAVGDRVAIDPQVPCGRCPDCRSGRAAVCSAKHLPGLQIPGLFSEFVAMPPATLHCLERETTWEQGAMVEPGAVACHALGRAKLAEDARVAILGAGPIGSLAALIRCAGSHPPPMVVDVKRGNLDRVASVTGARVVDARREAVVEVGLDYTDGEGFDAVLVANTASQSLNDAVALARRGSPIVAIGAAYADVPTVDVPTIVWRELELRGSFSFTSEEFKLVLSLIHDGLDVAGLITHRHPFEEAPEVFEQLGDGRDGIKTILSFD